MKAHKEPGTQQRDCPRKRPNTSQLRRVTCTHITVPTSHSHKHTHTHARTHAHKHTVRARTHTHTPERWSGARMLLSLRPPHWAWRRDREQRCLHPYTSPRDPTAAAAIAQSLGWSVYPCVAQIAHKMNLVLGICYRAWRLHWGSRGHGGGKSGAQNRKQALPRTDWTKSNHTTRGRTRAGP